MKKLTSAGEFLVPHVGLGRSRGQDASLHSRGHGASTIRLAEFVKDAFDMAADRLLAHRQLAGDIAVGAATREQTEYLGFAARQPAFRRRVDACGHYGAGRLGHFTCYRAIAA